MREYAEDTVFRSLVSSTTTFSARRRSLFLFTSDGSPPLYLVDNTAALWETLNTTLIERDPARIAINVDPGVAFSDGLHTGEGRALLRALDPRFAKRTSSCRALAVEVIAARVGAEQLSAYRLLMENVWAMIAEAFSARVVSVGQTTTADLEWWFRERMQVMGVGTWFHPSVDIRRHPSEPAVDKSPEIREGDMLHVDVGITAMGMNTDTQHLCYVLRANETKPPAGLLAGLRAGNGLQDMVRAEMVPGRTGDEVLAAVRRRMREARVDGDIYSHPIGDYGHSAGAVIGMTNMQGGVPESGGLRVLENYWTSVELAARVYVPEWGRVERVSRGEHRGERLTPVRARGGRILEQRDAGVRVGVWPADQVPPHWPATHGLVGRAGCMGRAVVAVSVSGCARGCELVCER